MGAIAEVFRCAAGVVRSNHPTASFAARGPLAQAIVTGHPLEDAFGEASPLARLYDVGALVLLLGVAFDCCSTLHFAERRALGKHQRLVDAGAPLSVAGVRRWVRFREPDVDSSDFAELGAEYEVRGGVRRSRVGVADARVVEVRALVDFAVDWFKRHRR